MEARPAHMRMSSGPGKRNSATGGSTPNPSSSDRGFQIQEPAHSPSSGLPAVKSSRQITKSQEKLSSLSGLILIAAKPIKKKKIHRRLNLFSPSRCSPTHSVGPGNSLVNSRQIGSTCNFWLQGEGSGNKAKRPMETHHIPPPGWCLETRATTS